MDVNQKFFVPDDGNEVEQTRTRYHEIAKLKRAGNINKSYIEALTLAKKASPT